MSVTKMRMNDRVVQETSGGTRTCFSKGRPCHFSECGEVLVLGKKLINFFSLGQQCRYHFFVKTPSCLRRLWNFLEMVVGILLTKPFFVGNSLASPWKPVRKFQHVADIVDRFEGTHNEIQPMRQAPDGLRDAIVFSDFSTDEVLQMKNRPISFSNHAVCSICCDTAEFRRGDSFCCIL